MTALPDIIYFLSDQHRYHAMSHAGDPNIRTPNMDRMARSGLSFSRAYANCPICTPSRATMFTGRHAHANGAPGLWSVMHDVMPTLPRELIKAGYHTCYIGKWHLGGVDKRRREILHPVDGRPLKGVSAPTPLKARGGFQDWFAFESTNDHFRSYYYQGDASSPTFLDGYETDALTDLAIRYLRNYRRDQPLFLVLSVTPPHFPFEVPMQYKRFVPEALEVRPNFVDREDWRARLADYYGMVENLDENLGKLRDALRGMPRFHDALMLYYSDHGEYGGSHARMARKEHPHEESVRIPMIWHWPGRIPAGQAPEALFGMVDLMPTTLGLIHLEIPAYCQGRDFSPLLRGLAFEGPNAVLLEMVDSPRWDQDHVNWRGIVTRRHKYAIYEDGLELLYDLEKDPYEMDNVAAKAIALKRDMRRQLLGLMQSSEEPFFHVCLEHLPLSDA